MRAEVSGPIATAIASREAVERDILWVTVTCLIVVALSIGLYFRRLRAIPLTGVPAMIGAMMAFGVAELAFGYLNSSTAFLGSIILGNGINYAIVADVALRGAARARRRRRAPRWRARSPGTWRGTLVASICASAAYASLMVTSFRGFYQFGVMGAVGALVLLGRDVHRRCRRCSCCSIAASRARALRGRAPLDLGPLARFIGRTAGAVSVVVAVLSVVSRVGLAALPARIRSSTTSASSTPSSSTTEEAQRVRPELRQAVRPLALAHDRARRLASTRSSRSSRPSAARTRERSARPNAPAPASSARSSTIYDLLPGPPEAQQRKLALIAHIHKLTHDKALAVLDAESARRSGQSTRPPTCAS